MDMTYSPLLAILTGSVEVAVGLWALRGPGRREITLPTSILLFLLAGYQFAEALVCAQPRDLFFSRVAFSTIVWLPPVGIWLVTVLSGSERPSRLRFVQGWFVGAALLAGWVWLDPDFVSRSICEVVLARYEHTTPFYPIYGAFYMIGVGVMLLAPSVALVRQEDRVLRQHLADVQMGSVFFVVPGLLVQALNPNLAGMSPSLMCHFAAFLALYLMRMVARERREGEAHASVQRSQQTHATS